MLITFCSTTGAPGVSGWSVLVAGITSPNLGHDLIVAEADASGGVMATRYGIGVSPGSAELVIACGGPGLDLPSIGRRVGDRAWMVPAPVIPGEAAAVWSEHNSQVVAQTLARDARAWIVDVGRFDRSCWAWHEAAMLTVVLVPGWTDALVCAKPVLSELVATGSVKPLVVGKSDYGVHELCEFFGLNVGTLPRADVVAEAAAVWGGSRSWRRGTVWSAADKIAADVSETFALVRGVH